MNFFKSSVCLGLMLFGQLSFADVQNVVVSERRVILPVTISSSTVILSSAGYSAPLVKILIPSIADVTVMNHRNLGAEAPCISTYDTQNPNDVIKNDSRIIQQPVVIRLIKDAITTEVNGVPTCSVTLTETIDTKIRGINFTHARTTTMPDRTVADCK